MVENVGILKLSIRIDWIVIMWPLQTRMDQKRQSYLLTPRLIFFFFYCTQKQLNPLFVLFTMSYSLKTSFRLHNGVSSVMRRKI